MNFDNEVYNRRKPGIGSNDVTTLPTPFLEILVTCTQSSSLRRSGLRKIAKIGFAKRIKYFFFPCVAAKTT